MPSPRRPRTPAKQREQRQLVSLCKALLDSGSRLEDRYWESRLEQVLVKQLSSGQDALLESTLADLASQQPELADLLLEQLQATSESFSMQSAGQDWDILLLSAPIAVWTRYQMPAVEFSEALLEQLSQAIKQTIVAPSAKVLICARLFSLDDMPRSFSDVWQWSQMLGRRLITGQGQLPAPAAIDPLPYILADNRHMLMAVAVPAKQAFFRWQIDEQTDKTQCLQAWRGYTEGLIARLLTGCQFEILLPQAYHYSIQESERLIRPIAVSASCQWLKEALSLKPNQLKATIAAVGQFGVDEYRIGYQRTGSSDVIYGTIWPMFESADSDIGNRLVDTVDEISAILKNGGVGEITRIPGILMPEQCEDCSAPLFPNQNGDLVHAELPEEAFDAPAHFH